MRVDILALIIICLLSGAAAYIFIPSHRLKNAYIFTALLAVLIRVVMVAYLYSSGTDTFGTDGLLYHKEGIKIANQLAQGVPFYSIKYSYTWYTVFIGFVYHIFGVNRYLVSYINIEFAFIAAILLFRMAVNHKYRFTNAAFISLAFLYFPNLFLWTTDSRKEALLIFVCFVCWYCVQRFIMDVRDQKANTPVNVLRIVAVCLLMWLCTLIRIYMFIPIAAGIMVSQLLLYTKSRSRLSAIFAVAVFFSVFVIYITTMNPLTHNYHAITFPKEEQTVSMAQDVTTKVKTVKTIAENRNVFVSVLNYVMLPYPNKIEIADIQGNKSLQMLVSMDMITWYICLLLMLSGIYASFRRKDSCFIGMIVFIGAYILINAIVVENVSDTIYRYRSVIVGIALLLIDGDTIGKFMTYFEIFPGQKTGSDKTSAAGSLSMKN